MKIIDMFKKEIDRPINGVIKVMQTDDENRKQELEEYIITRELQKHFGSFYDNYEQGVSGATDKMGVWISGFFGSGKSHFLKILSYLLANDEINGKKALDYFKDKFDYDPFRYQLMCRLAEAPTEVILFNIDAKSGKKDQDAIIRVFTKVFYEHCGYYGDDMKVAAFERFLDRQGQLDAFKQAFTRINGGDWIKERETFSFWGEDIIAALIDIGAMSEQVARHWFDGTETAEISIDKLTREIQEYVDGKGKGFHLIFLADEVGQYIGDDSGLMLNLQTVVEELGTKCRGKAWVIVTSQEDIDSVTRVKGNDFSKIQGRFNTRLSLSSASVDEVIKRRILAKNDEADKLLRLMYRQNAATMRNLFSFAPGTVADLKGYSSEDEYVESFPFVPYQFKLLQEVLLQVRKHGSSGRHLSGGERSMLSSFQEAAQAAKRGSESSFVPFFYFYDTINTFLDGAIRRVINRAEDAARAGDGLKPEDVDVLKLLFLVRYVSGLAANVENLSTLMISDIHADKIALRGTLRESLERLARQNYVTRSGDNYLFLTDEEQDINREIRGINVDPAEVLRKIGDVMFGEIYPNKKFRYNTRYDFAYDQMVDNTPLSQKANDIRLRLITDLMQDEGADLHTQLVMESRANAEAVLLLKTGLGYYQEFLQALRVDKYVKQRNLSQLPESIVKIIKDRRENAREQEKAAAGLLREAILKGSFYAAGERLNIKASTAVEAIDQAMTALVEDVYSKLHYVGVFAQTDEDIRRVLTDTNAQESMLQTEAANTRAISDMDQFLTARARQHMPVTVAELQKRYQSRPYGWREADIAALLAALWQAQRVQLSFGGARLLPGDRRAVDCLRKKNESEKTVVELRVAPSAQLLDKARKLAGELFHTMDLRQDEDGLCGQIESLLGALQKRNDVLLPRYSTAIPYPGREVLDNGHSLFETLAFKRHDHIAYLEAFTAAEDQLLDWKEDFEPVEAFFKNQLKIFSDAWTICESAQKESGYFADNAQAVEAMAVMRDILNDKKPYRRVIELPGHEQTLKKAYQRVNEGRRERVGEAIVQARSDLHSLAGDDPALRQIIREIDDELDKRGGLAASADSPTALDAMITQIYGYANGQRRKIEGILAAAGESREPPALRVQTISRYELLGQERLSSPQEVEQYIDKLRQRLLEELQRHDVLRLI